MCLIKGHWMVKLILQQVDLQPTSPSTQKYHSGIGSFGPVSIPNVGHSMTAIQIAKHERLLVVLPAQCTSVTMDKPLRWSFAVGHSVNYIKMNGSHAVHTK